jgi:PTH1 family peptidyl-tRNA hydrolase
VKLIVGLGNPGGKYARSRHNVGFIVLDCFAERHGLRFNQKRAHSLVAQGRLGEIDLALAKPQTYMNVSGRAVQGLLMIFRARPTNLLVVYDDFDLPLGRLRLRERGSAGTHNGMRSIVQAIGTQEFPRLRIGIGNTQEQSARDFVLGEFGPADWSRFEDARDRAVEAIETFILAGTPAAMNRFNG